MGPGVGRLDLRGGEPADGDQRRAQRHLGGQLRLVPLGPLGEVGHGRQQGLQVPDGLAGGAAPQRLQGRGLEVGHRPGVVVGGRELGGQLGRVAVPGRSVGPFQPLASGGVQPRPAAGRDPVVQHRPVEVVVELGTPPTPSRPPRPPGRWPAGSGPGGRAPRSAPRPPRRRRARLRGRGGGELDPGDGGRLQHGQVGGVQPLELELEQAAEVVRDLALAAAGTGRQLPAPAHRAQDAGVGPGLGELHDEQRHPVGASVHQPGQLLGNVGSGEVAPQHRGHRRDTELAQPELGGQAAQPQAGAGVGDRGGAGQGVGRPVGAHQQQPGRRRPPGQPLQQVDGRGVGPVEVLEHQHQRTVRGHGLQRLGRLPQHPLPRPAQGPAAPGRPGRPGSTRAGIWISQVGARRDSRAARPRGRPGTAGRGRRRRAGTVRGRPAARGTGPGRPGPPAPARPRPANASTSVDFPMPASPVTNTSCRTPCLGEAVQPAQPLQLRLPPDRGHARHRRDRVGAGPLLDRGEELVAAAVDGADHPLLAAAVADRPAGGLHPAGQRRVGHEAAAPDLVQQLGPGHHPVAVTDQVGEDLEHLGLQVAGDASAAQLIALVVELAVAEPVDHPACLPNSSMSSPRLGGARELTSRGTLQERRPVIIAAATAAASVPSRR